jgi:NTE family protein
LQGLSKLVHSARAFKRELARSRDQTPERPKVGIALGGGFARGLCHIGVIKVLEEEKIPIDYVAGTSVGAVIGAAYCSGISVKELEEIAALVRFGHFARWTISRYGVASNDRMKGFLNKLLRCKTFEELRIPLAVAATDFATGDGVVFRSGELVEAVRASCAYPGMFLPVNVNGRLLVDGLLAHAVPAEPLRQMGAERVVAIYLSAHWVHLKGPRHVFDVIGQCFSIAQEKMCYVWKPHADVILEPNVAGFTYDGFDRAADLIRVGEDAARAALPHIRSWLPQAPEKPPREAPALVPAPSPLQP